MEYPEGIAVASNGDVDVVDYYRVQTFNSSGSYLSQFGGPGVGNGDFTIPYGIALDGSGNVYVTDTSPVSAVRIPIISRKVRAAFFRHSLFQEKRQSKLISVVFLWSRMPTTPNPALASSLQFKPED